MKYEFSRESLLWATGAQFSWETLRDSIQCNLGFSASREKTGLHLPTSSVSLSERRFQGILSPALLAFPAHSLHIPLCPGKRPRGKVQKVQKLWLPSYLQPVEVDVKKEVSVAQTSTAIHAGKNWAESTNSVHRGNKTLPSTKTFTLFVMRRMKTVTTLKWYFSPSGWAKLRVWRLTVCEALKTFILHSDLDV